MTQQTCTAEDDSESIGPARITATFLVVLDFYAVPPHGGTALYVQITNITKSLARNADLHP